MLHLKLALTTKMLCFLATAAATIWTVSMATGCLDHLQYAGDAVLSFPVENKMQWEEISSLLTKHIPTSVLDIWKEPNYLTKQADVYIPKRYRKDVVKELHKNHVTFKIMIDDISKLLKKENYHKRRRKRFHDDTIIGRYVKYDEMITWLQYMRSLYKAFMQNITLGHTYENREIIVYKLSTGGRNKPAIWIDAGLHAREWVAPAVALYILNELLTKYVWIDEIKEFMDKLDWYFLVVANPDGYEYSHDHYRFWRKNTRLVSDSCWGVDLNRNWGYKWGTGSSGVNTEPCGETYQGPEPESELEVKHMSRFLLSHADNIQAYISLHSYTQNWFTRWAYTSDDFPSDNDDLMNVSLRAVEAIKSVNNKTYGAGNAAKLLYSFSGGSPDWARGVAGIKFPYLIELRDTGTYGFLLPEAEIEPTALEAWAGIKVVVREVIKRYVLTATQPHGTSSQLSPAASASAVATPSLALNKTVSPLSPVQTNTLNESASSKPSVFTAAFATADDGRSPKGGSDDQQSVVTDIDTRVATGSLAYTSSNTNSALSLLSRTSYLITLTSALHLYNVHL